MPSLAARHGFGISRRRVGTNGLAARAARSPSTVGVAWRAARRNADAGGAGRRDGERRGRGGWQRAAKLGAGWGDIFRAIPIPVTPLRRVTVYATIGARWFYSTVPLEFVCGYEVQMDIASLRTPSQK